MKDENELPITNTMRKDKRNSASQDDWRDYAYGGKSLLDDTQENTSNKKAEKLEKKRNLVIGYVQPIENANTEKRTKAEDLESTQH
ncbi:hypothetical protein CMK22_03390 [Candidatus Poribacteria bacterium]|nr:hypothetical protein [Candidatus Poribacteria bacterium]